MTPTPVIYPCPPPLNQPALVPVGYNAEVVVEDPASEEEDWSKSNHMPKVRVFLNHRSVNEGTN